MCSNHYRRVVALTGFWLILAALPTHARDVDAAAAAQGGRPPVDMLWVIDDSALMHEAINTAMGEISPMLAAAAASIDLRVAMTTTNPSPTARTRCRGECLEHCGNHECDGFCDVVVGCLKACPGDCHSDCSPAGCEGDDICYPVPGCLEMPYDFDAEVAIDAGLSDGLGSGPLFLPGGGGGFYAEDSLVVDCDGDVVGIDDCSGLPSFGPFFPSGQRQRFLEHAGFLTVLETASCTTELLDITTLATAVCTPGDPECCERLVASCDDGATVLASQLCDLLRAMGGTPPGLVGRRSHSGPEHGLRSARRLAEQMLPALPRDYQATCGTSPCPYEARLHLRLDCDTGPGCAPCDPRVDSACYVVPLVTVFLSDEEDAFFKDDCQTTPSSADEYQLPADCVWRDGDPTTIDVCDRNYCQDSSFFFEPPIEFNPDQVARATTSAHTIQWRDDYEIRCHSTSADPAFDCASYPQCLADNLAHIPTMMATSCTADPCVDQFDQASCEAIQIDIGLGPQAFCLWDSAMNRCGLWCNQHTPWGGDIPSQQVACEADPMCRWDRAKVNQPYGRDAVLACRMRYPMNDCQACKRHIRTLEAVEGVVMDEFSNDPLIGFVDLGPVYAVVREAGVEAFGGFFVNVEEDPCELGPLSWGHGDGQAYRDVAAATGGRSGNICDQSYLPFLEQLIADLHGIANLEIFSDGFESGTTNWSNVVGLDEVSSASISTEAASRF